MSKLSKTEVFAKDIFCAAFGRWQPPDEKATAELIRWSTHLAQAFVEYLENHQQAKP